MTAFLVRFPHPVMFVHDMKNVTRVIKSRSEPDKHMLFVCNGQVQRSNLISTLIRKYGKDWDDDTKRNFRAIENKNCHILTEDDDVGDEYIVNDLNMSDYIPKNRRKIRGERKRAKNDGTSYVYAFELYKGNTYKFGMADISSLCGRLSTYHGDNSPRRVVYFKRVHNPRNAEAEMLKMIRQLPSLRRRPKTKEFFDVVEPYQVDEQTIETILTKAEESDEMVHRTDVQLIQSCT